MRQKLLLVCIIVAFLCLGACHGETEKFESQNGVLGENAKGKTPQESVELLNREDEDEAGEGVNQQDSIEESQMSVRTPLEGLQEHEKEVVTVLDTFYQYLMNGEFQKVDKYILPEKARQVSYGQYYKENLEDKGIVLLDFMIDRITEHQDTETLKHYFIIEVDIEQVIDKQVVTYRDTVTLVKEQNRWYIDTIETKAK